VHFDNDVATAENEDRGDHGLFWDIFWYLPGKTGKIHGNVQDN
jgi:hypothetical protein